MSSENQVTSVKTVPFAGNPMAFTTALTLREYIDANQLYGDIMGKRCAEIRLPADAQSFLATYPDLLNIIIIATPEDPDTVMVVPILATIVNGSARLAMRILRDDADLSMFDGMLPDLDLLNELDELDLPQAFFFDEKWQLVAQWGPRPKAAATYLNTWLRDNPEYERLADSDDDADQDAYMATLDRLTYEMRVWYNSNLNRKCILEVCDLLANLQATGEEQTGSEAT